MDLTFSESETAFREELRAWLQANDPGPEPTDEGQNYGWRRDWQRRLYEDGWAAVHWPREYGGRGASLTESAIFFEELGRARAPLPRVVQGRRTWPSRRKGAVGRGAVRARIRR